MSARDRRCFFYIFSLPSPWRPYMTFNIKLAFEWFEAGATGKCRLASAVVPMGWRSAVAVCQECHRSMLRAAWRMPRRVSSPSLEAGLNWNFELRRDRVFPFNGDAGQTRSWEVYVDNLF